MLMDFADGYRDVAELMLTIMSYEGYLVAFEKVLPDGRFLVHASVPDEKVEAYREFFGGLKEQGYFRSFEFYTFHWFRNPPMKTEMYDFDEGLWDFDWSTEAKVDQSGGLVHALGEGEVRRDRSEDPEAAPDGRQQEPGRHGRDP